MRATTTTVRRALLTSALLTVPLGLAGCGTADDTTRPEGEMVVEEAAPGTATEEPSDGEQAPAGADADTDPEACDGTVGAVRVEEVEVPDGATCVLDGTSVAGNVRVGSDATFDARAVDVDGDVQAEGARAVDVTAASVVQGNIQVEQGGSSTVTDTRIDGDLQWEAQSGPLVAERNTIDGNLQAEENRGGLTVADNTIDGNLPCGSNDPAPDGGGNAVSGDREGQCSDL